MDDKHRTLITIRELLGNPIEYDSDYLSNEDLEISYHELVDLMVSHGIRVAFDRSIPLAARYNDLLNILDDEVNPEVLRGTHEQVQHLWSLDWPQETKEAVVNQSYPQFWVMNDDLAPYESTVFDHIGKPKVTPPETIADDQVAPATRRLLEYLKERSISVERGSIQSDREWYAYIVSSVLPATILIQPTAPEEWFYFSPDDNNLDSAEHAEIALCAFLNALVQPDWEPVANHLSSAGLRSRTTSLLGPAQFSEHLEGIRNEYRALRIFGYSVGEVKQTEQGRAVGTVHCHWCYRKSMYRRPSIRETMRVGLILERIPIEATEESEETDPPDLEESYVERWMISEIHSDALRL